jgi:hypothetical protein
MILPILFSVLARSANATLTTITTAEWVHEKPDELQACQDRQCNFWPQRLDFDSAREQSKKFVDWDNNPALVVTKGNNENEIKLVNHSAKHQHYVLHCEEGFKTLETDTTASLD